MAKQGVEFAKFVDRSRRGCVRVEVHDVVADLPDLAEAFDELYYLERACKTLVLAYSTGQKLNVMPDKVAEQTAKDWELYADSAFTHFDEMKMILDKKDPSYAS